MRLFLVALYAACLGPDLSAQTGDSVRVDSVSIDTGSAAQSPPVPHGAVPAVAAPTPPAIPAPAPPTPEQAKYLDGLRRVSRGISQLKTAIEQTNRAQAGTDTLARRRAVRRLGGYCGSARSFMSGGRSQMQPLAYEDTTRIKARKLTQRVDEIIAYTKTCEVQATDTPSAVTAELVKRLQAYEAALADFRIAVGLQRDTVSH
jgi:hypothetical protein